jgi:membrane associated rhomboid family serine protease
MKWLKGVTFQVCRASFCNGKPSLLSTLTINDSNVSMNSSYSVSSIPCITRIFVLACSGTFIFQNLFQLRNSVYAFQVRDILFLHESYRCWTSVFFHGNILHLLMNMASLVSLGSLLESTLYGSLAMLLTLLWSIVITSGVSMGLVLGLGALSVAPHHVANLLYYSWIDPYPLYQLADLDSMGNSTSFWYTHPHAIQSKTIIPYDEAFQWTHASSIGFSGVLFHLLVLEVYHPGHSQSAFQQRSIYGLFHVSPKYYPWALLLAAQFLLPNVSFLGHVSGILAGYIQVLSTRWNRDNSIYPLYIPSSTHLLHLEQMWILPWIQRFSVKYIPIQTLPTWNTHNESHSNPCWNPCQTWWRVDRVSNTCRHTCHSIGHGCARLGTWIRILLFGTSRGNGNMDPNLELGGRNWFGVVEEESEWIGIPPPTTPNHDRNWEHRNNPTTTSTWI